MEIEFKFHGYDITRKWADDDRHKETKGKSSYKIRNILETPGLLPITIDSKRLLPQSLHCPKIIIIKSS